MEFDVSPLLFCLMFCHHYGVWGLSPRSKMKTPPELAVFFTVVCCALAVSYKTGDEVSCRRGGAGWGTADGARGCQEHTLTHPQPHLPGLPYSDSLQ